MVKKTWFQHVPTKSGDFTISKWDFWDHWHWHLNCNKPRREYNSKNREEEVTCHQQARLLSHLYPFMPSEKWHERWHLHGLRRRLRIVISPAYWPGTWPCSLWQGQAAALIFRYSKNCPKLLVGWRELGFLWLVILNRVWRCCNSI